MTGRTDRSNTGFELAGPVVCCRAEVVMIVKNIGMAARAMGNFVGGRNFGSSKPRDGGDVSARGRQAGADHILDHVALFDTVEQAVADLALMFAHRGATTGPARGCRRGRPRPHEIVDPYRGCGKAGILFGRGAICPADEMVGLPTALGPSLVNPGIRLLNLAQAVLLMDMMFQLSTIGALPFATARALRARIRSPDEAVFENLCAHSKGRVFASGREQTTGGRGHTFAGQLRTSFARMEPTSRTCNPAGVGMASRKAATGPQGRVLGRRTGDAHGERLAGEHGRARPAGQVTVRGLARILRRNQTDAERLLWQGPDQSRRFAGQFKRQTPRRGPAHSGFSSLSRNRLADRIVNANRNGTIAPIARRGGPDAAAP